jgi:acetolactate synthase-1/2/3 large subunit
MPTGAEIVAKYLEQEGVEYFWVMRSHDPGPVGCDGLQDKNKIHHLSTRTDSSPCGRWIFPRDPQAGVVLVHVGPGMTNAVTGVANAALDSSAMVAIAGDVPSFHFGQDPHQEVKLHFDGSQCEIYRPFVKRAFRVHDVKFIADIMGRAFNVATSGRSGAVLVDVPMDIFSNQCECSTENLTRRKVTGKRIAGDASEIEKAIKMLQNAKNPVIYLGGGVILSDAHQEATQLAEYLGIPVATTLMGKGAIPEDHLLSIGMTGFWGTPIANEMTKQADVILAIGTRFPETDSSSWLPQYTFAIPPTKLIHVDIDPQEIGDVFPTEIGIIGDAKPCMHPCWRCQIEHFKKTGQKVQWSKEL